MRYKKYFRKTSLKQKGVGDFFLKEVAEKNPKVFLEVGVFHGVTARNVCELLYKMHRQDFKYVGLDLFEETVEGKLIQPTFVIGYPLEVSPLSRRNNDNPDIADRFELFIGGKEIANGFCELNDPDDQAERFKAQVAAKDAGDNEAMSFDEDYVISLEHGMPPAVGVGIGIDRLVMMITNQTSIRDVILFPQLKS